jgi:hypothetical protein
MAGNAAMLLLYSPKTLGTNNAGYPSDGSLDLSKFNISKLFNNSHIYMSPWVKTGNSPGEGRCRKVGKILEAARNFWSRSKYA